MNKKMKIGLSLTICLSLVSGGAKLVHDYKNNINTKREVNRFISSSFFDSTYFVPEGLKYSDFDPANNIYYVHKKGNRLILSTENYLKNYECLGIYDSKNSADAIFYYQVVTGDDIILYNVVSYDDLEGKKSPFNIIDNVTLIDENAPEEVSAYVPEPSIVSANDYAKSLN